MNRNHPERVKKLSGQMGRPADSDLLPVPAIVAMLNACKPNGDDGQPFPSEEAYRAACAKAGRGLKWLSYAEMCEVWAESGRAIAEERAQWAAAALPPGTRIGDRVW